MSKYERLSAPIRELVQNPDINVLSDSLSKGAHGLHEVAPNIAQSLQTIGAKSINYLQSKIPKPASELIGDPDYEPSKTEQRNWLHVHDIVNDPISALDHVRHGTLTPDHMEALQTVHPELLDEMRQKVMEHMDSKTVKKLSSSTKLALGSFLGSPVTGANSPQSILMNQAALQKPGMGPQQGPKSTLGGLKDLNVAQRSSTQTDHEIGDT